jgi:hypothetical protein
MSQQADGEKVFDGLIYNNPTYANNKIDVCTDANNNDY